MGENYMDKSGTALNEILLAALLSAEAYRILSISPRLRRISRSYADQAWFSGGHVKDKDFIAGDSRSIIGVKFHSNIFKSELMQDIPAGLHGGLVLDTISKKQSSRSEYQ